MPPTDAAAAALARHVAAAAPFIPMVIRVRDDAAAALPDALAIADDAPAEQLIARVSSALRLRTLHSTVLGRAKSLKDERNIVAELPAGDPLDDATVLLIGRGRHHPTLSVAVGERMGVIGALSIDQGAGCLKAREVDGIIIGDGLAAGLGRRLPRGAGRGRALPRPAGGGARRRLPTPSKLPNFIRARDPLVLLRTRGAVHPDAGARDRAQAPAPLDRMQGHDRRPDRAVQRQRVRPGARACHRGCGERGARLSLARFSFDDPIDRRTSMDAARLVSRLVRDVDFACRQDDGSILFAFGDTDLRDAHVVARRLASVLKHTMLRADRERPGVSPSVTLATLKPADTMHTLLARVAPRPVAAA